MITLHLSGRCEARPPGRQHLQAPEPGDDRRRIGHHGLQGPSGAGLTICEPMGLARVHSESAELWFMESCFCRFRELCFGGSQCTVDVLCVYFGCLLAYEADSLWSFAVCLLFVYGVSTLVVYYHVGVTLSGCSVCLLWLSTAVWV
jgi:hypothetical protein